MPAATNEFLPLGRELRRALAISDETAVGAIDSFLVSTNEEIVLRLEVRSDAGAEESASSVVAVLRGVRDFELSHRKTAPSVVGETVAQMDILYDDPLLWEYGPYSQIFGQAPLPDPYRFFLEYSQLVRDELKLRRDPVHYLNWRGGLSLWLELVYSRVYSLMVAPSPLIEGAIELLDRQVASYEVLPATPQQTPQHAAGDAAPVLVGLGDSWVVATDISRMAD